MQCLDKISMSHILEPSCDKMLIEKRGMLQHHYEETVGRFLQSIPLRANSWCRVMFHIFLLSYSTSSHNFKIIMFVFNQDLYMVYSYKWANIKLVQQALHVREVCQSTPLLAPFVCLSWWHRHFQQGTLTEWVRCNTTLKRTYLYDIKSTVDYHKNFTHKDIRALIYRWVGLSYSNVVSC